MKNYIYMTIMLVPAVVVLLIISGFSFILQLFYLPSTILNHLVNYDLEQARKHKNIVR